jgi:ABC-2 type transport system permease protein
VSVLAHHVRTAILELVRYPAYSAPTLAFPTLLFLLVGSSKDTTSDAEQALAGFSALAVLGVALFQFGVGIAADRASPWESFLRTLPVAVHMRLVARVLSALPFAAAAAAGVGIAALLTTPIASSSSEWAGFAVALLAGGVPFALGGIALGYWVRPRAALPVANVLFLPLSYAGALWGGPRSLPAGLERVSSLTPTRQWSNWLVRSLAGDFWHPRAIGALAAYGAIFGGLAAWGYLRDEGERFT